jgi:hypothetical protein
MPKINILWSREYALLRWLQLADGLRIPSLSGVSTLLLRPLCSRENGRAWMGGLLFMG